MWKLDHREGWVPRTWCFWLVVLEKTLETARRSNQSILKEINPEHSLAGLMLKLKFQYLATWCKEHKWLFQFTGKDPGAGKGWRQKEKRMAEEEMGRYYHWLNWHEFEQTLGDSGKQRNPACYSWWDNKRIRHDFPTEQYSLNMGDTASPFNENFIEVSVDIYTVIINNKDAGNFSQIPKTVIFYIQKDFCLVTLVISCFYFIFFISFLISL